MNTKKIVEAKIFVFFANFFLTYAKISYMKKIADELIKNFEKYRLDRVFRLNEVQGAKKEVSEMFAQLNDITLNNEYDPSHKVYIHAQHILSLFAETVGGFKELKAFTQLYERFENEFMPSYPPMSPVTTSFNMYYFLFDLRLGSFRETISTIFYTMTKNWKLGEMLKPALMQCDRSSLRFYEHCGFRDDMIELEDIFTNEKKLVVNPSNYKGEAGEIWLVRLLPNLDAVYDYKIAVTTPYIIRLYGAEDWLQFFARQDIYQDENNGNERYHNFMKFNLDKRFWFNYVLDAYVDHTDGCIYLTGLPDIKGTKPHEL